jgi:hypothetical protein
MGVPFLGIGVWFGNCLFVVWPTLRPILFPVKAKKRPGQAVERWQALAQVGQNRGGKKPGL